eukprot:Gb_27310 [translate_table: standard]
MGETAKYVMGLTSCAQRTLYLHHLMRGLLFDVERTRAFNLVEVGLLLMEFEARKLSFDANVEDDDEAGSIFGNKEVDEERATIDNENNNKGRVEVGNEEDDTLEEDGILKKQDTSNILS